MSREYIDNPAEDTAFTLRRIEDALDRIADALERLVPEDAAEPVNGDEAAA